ncbi:unnamed protein product [Blepharisma stoltei]|uniref:Uncharacterized protein n=1 Tax=Blepharisma stoltei TaxID=1481888 RepID=A0AAU9K908_9CILI|nr:unnamed protein product [Blepharisma stoltei]
MYYILQILLFCQKFKTLLKSQKLLLAGESLIKTAALDAILIITIEGHGYTSSQEGFLFSSTENLLQYLFNSTTEPATVGEIR